MTDVVKRQDLTAIDAEQGRRRSISRRAAFAEFVRHPSPWGLFALVVGGAIARGLHGDWRLSDALLPLVMIAVFPVYEWLIHVFVLHWKPRRIGRLTVDSILARKHRLHHADPRDVPLVFIPWQAMLWIVPSTVAISVFAFQRLGLGLTFLVAISTAGLLYEWVHFLVHSDYRPRSRLYRAVWNNHRLHHYKNEHYWFTVTSSGTADRLFRTYPEPTSVPKSKTARNLHALSDVGVQVAAAVLVALAVSAALLAGVTGRPAAAGATTPTISGPLQPYFPPPFANSCTVHEFGEGVAPPLSGIPDDPLCVEYAKRDITITDGGAIRFLAAEPARFLVAAKCAYWQQDHWSVQFAPGQLPVIRWDGSYWFDLGTGQAGGRLHDLRIGGVPIGAARLARLVAPFDATLAGYFRAFGQGGPGAGWSGTTAFVPACAR